MRTMEEDNSENATVYARLEPRSVCVVVVLLNLADSALCAAAYHAGAALTISLEEADSDSSHRHDRRRIHHCTIAASATGAIRVEEPRMVPVDISLLAIMYIGWFAFGLWFSSDPIRREMIR